MTRSTRTSPAWRVPECQRMPPRLRPASNGQRTTSRVVLTARTDKGERCRRQLSPREDHTPGQRCNPVRNRAEFGCRNRRLSLTEAQPTPKHYSPEGASNERQHPFPMHPRRNPASRLPRTSRNHTTALPTKSVSPHGKSTRSCTASAPSPLIPRCDCPRHSTTAHKSG